MTRVAVIGAGMSGLAAANKLLELEPGAHVVVLEASDRAGGSVLTERTGGCVIERGPDSILTEKPWALALARRIGLESEIVPTQTGPVGAFVVSRGRLERVPDGFALLAPTQAKSLILSPVLTWRGKLRAGLDLVLPRAPPTPDESLGSFVRRRFGQEVLDTLAQPLVGGIYGADADQLSLRATMPRFLEVEQTSRSVILGLLKRQASARGRKETKATGARYGLFVAMRSGMQAFSDALAARLGSVIRLGVRVRELDERAGGGWDVVTADGQREHFDAVIPALQTWRTGELVEKLDATLAAELAAIPHGSSANATFAWPRTAIPRPLNAFGFVVPETENRAILASTWASEKYPNRAPADTALIRVFLGGPRHQDLVQRSEAEIVASARAELRDLMGITASPTITAVQKHSRVLPLYHVGHLDRVASIERLADAHPGLALAGNGFRGVGLPDVIKAGEAAAAAALARGESRAGTPS